MSTARPTVSNLDTTPRRWKAVDRPALFPPAPLGNPNVAHFELVAINSKTATVRNHFITGELAYDVADVRVMDPAPWLANDGTRTAERVTGATWEPRTLASLRAAGIALGVDARSPYDTGERAQPSPWSTLRRHELPYLTGAQLAEELDRFGRVDFDGDDGTTFATVHADRQADGSYVVEVYAHDSEGVTVRETSEDANATMRAALTAWREAEAAYVAACEEEEETGREKDADAYYSRDDAAVEFANVAADWIAARLGVTS